VGTWWAPSPGRNAGSGWWPTSSTAALRRWCQLAGLSQSSPCQFNPCGLGGRCEISFIQPPAIPAAGPLGKGRLMSRALLEILVAPFLQVCFAIPGKIFWLRYGHHPGWRKQAQQCLGVCPAALQTSRRTVLILSLSAVQPGEQVLIPTLLAHPSWRVNSPRDLAKHFVRSKVC